MFGWARKLAAKDSYKLFFILPVVIVALLFFVAAFAENNNERSSLFIAIGKDQYTISGPRKNLGKYPLNANIFETLTTFDEHYNLLPCLATSWKYKGDKRWRFFLREGVKFHDGSVFDSNAVKVSLEKSAKNGTSLLAFTKIEKVDEHVVDITTKNENRLVPYILSNPFMAIEKHGNVPVGTGPFMFEDYKTDQFLQVERNGKYWGEPSSAHRIIFRFIPDGIARMNAFMAGEVDLTLQIYWNHLNFLREQPNTQILFSPPGSYVALLILTKGCLKDKNLRKAIAMGIDRKSIAATLWNESAIINQTLIPPHMLQEHAHIIKDISFDPAQAKTLVEGKKKNLTLTLVVGFPNAQIFGELPEIIQSQLKQIGIDLKIIKINDMGLYHSMLRKKEGDLWLEFGSFNSADLTFIPHLLFHPDGYYPKSMHTDTGSKNFIDYIESARKTGEMRKYISLALKEVINNQNLIVPIANLPQVIVARKDISCTSLNPTLLTIQWDHFYRK